jgi:peptidyl-prolyl cis-trans isomerase C
MNECIINPMQKTVISLTILLLVLLAACTPATPTAPPSTETPVPTATLVPTITPTPAPMAVVVNGEGILQSEYDAEVQRFDAAMQKLGKTYTPEERRTRILDEFIDQLLLAQAAAKAGYTIDDATLQARIDALTAKMPSSQALVDWQAQNFYTSDSFRITLRRQMAAAWQRDTLAASIPTEMEQVHARQIRVDDRATAEEILARLNSGVEFATMAFEYDPLLGGDLGWFPQGYLLQPAVDQAAYSLQPGQYSAIIETPIGFHIVLVEERAVHSLTTDARLMLQTQALKAWLEAQRTQSSVDVRVP